jgi:hypothetical protein
MDMLPVNVVVILICPSSNKVKIPSNKHWKRRPGNGGLELYKKC